MSKQLQSAVKIRDGSRNLFVPRPYRESRESRRARRRDSRSEVASNPECALPVEKFIESKPAYSTQTDSVNYTTSTESNSIGATVYYDGSNYEASANIPHGVKSLDIDQEAIAQELMEEGVKPTRSAVTSALRKKGIIGKAFSLVELIIVVATMFTLMGALMPALVKARESAKRVICTSNQKQIVAAATMYAGEDKDADYLPLEPGAASSWGLWNGTRWFGPGKLVGNKIADAKVFFCPSQSTYNEYNPTFGLQNAGVAGKSCLGSFYFHGDADTAGISIRLGRNANPVDVAFSSDYDTHSTPIEYDNGVWQDSAHKSGIAVWGKNVGFLDGHQEFVKGAWDSRYSLSGADSGVGTKDGTWGKLSRRQEK